VISSSDKGLKGDDMVGIAGGEITIDAGTDGVRSDNTVVVYDGSLNIEYSSEGIESSAVVINDGEITVNAMDDGINATQKVDGVYPGIEINGGVITVNMAQGDTDALDSNGYLYVNGGEIYLNAQSPFDYDGEGSYTGGTIYVNGTEVDGIYNQMMGGHGFGGGGFGGGPGGW